MKRAGNTASKGKHDYRNKNAMEAVKRRSFLDLTISSEMLENSPRNQKKKKDETNDQD